MPTRGYTPLIANMLRHEKISLMLQTSFEDVRNAFPNARVLYTGPIDEYFGCKFGRLPYRSLDLRWRTLDKERAQSTPVINYPEEFAFTRITEMKQLTGQVSPKTSLVAEHPCAYEPGRNEPYYPIPREETRALYALYEDEARRTEGVIFAGRLGSYQYLNMDQAVGAALAVFEKKIRMDGASD
jgi:UDP-galactopyranose mutase